METIEYKQLSLNFRKGLFDLVSDVEDVEDGEVSDNEQRQAIINQAQGKLDEYDHLVNTLEDHFAVSLKTETIGEKMEYIRGLLAKIAKK